MCPGETGEALGLQHRVVDPVDGQGRGARGRPHVPSSSRFTTHLAHRHVPSTFAERAWVEVVELHLFGTALGVPVFGCG
jgi:hypothetical protein